MELYLIRHPRPAVAPGICYGQSDLPLAEAVEPIAERLRALLPADCTIFTSPLQRARLLAEALGPATSDARLMEMHFGEWELRSYDQIGAALQGWEADPLGFRAPDGESARELHARVTNWFDEWRTTPGAASSRTVVVAHGGPLRMLAGHLLGIPAERAWCLDFACGAVTRLDVEPWGNVLRGFNL